MRQSHGRDSSERDAVRTGETAGPEAEERRRPEGDATTPKGDAVALGSCSSITNPQTRHSAGSEDSVSESLVLVPEVVIEEEGEKQVLLNATCGIDWFEFAGGIEWTRIVPGIFDELAMAKRLAQKNRCPVPFELPNCTVLVQPSGIGSGKDSHKEYCLDWRGVTIGISGRKHRDRQLHNFVLQMTGEPCLLVGVQAGWKMATAIVAQFGGTIIEEWLRRLDVCIDLPGLSIRDELIPAVQQERFVTSTKRWSIDYESEGPTGFWFGKAPRLRLLAYDKRLEATRKSPLYRQALCDRRWGGIEPQVATRLEWQARREWYEEFGIDTPSQAMANLSAIVGKMTAEGPRPFLRLTETVPDRKNRHQDRAATLPLWSDICEVVRKWTGPDEEPLKRIKRENINADRLYQMVCGCITSYANYRGKICENIQDVHGLLAEMHRDNRGTDAELFERWRKKAQASGVYDDIFRFPPADAA